MPDQYDLNTESSLENNKLNMADELKGNKVVLFVSIVILTITFFVAKEYFYYIAVIDGLWLLHNIMGQLDAHLFQRERGIIYQREILIRLKKIKENNESV